MVDPVPEGREAEPPDAAVFEDEQGGRIALEHANGWAGYDTLSAFLSDDGWYPLPIEGTTAFRCGFQGRNAKLRVVAHVNVEMEQLYLYAVAEVYAPEESRGAVAEFICRANYGMRIGNLEIDLNDGELRFKSSLDFEGETLTPRLIANAVYPAVTSMDRYLPGLLSVAYGGVDPFVALAEVEGFDLDLGEDDEG